MRAIDRYVRHIGFTSEDSLTDIRVPLVAVALHGVLPPGAFALVVPYEERALLVAHLAHATTQSVYSQWVGNVQQSQVAVAPSLRQLPGNINLLLPGDVLPMGNCRQGVSVYVMSLWGFVDANRTNPSIEPYIRAYTSECGLPSKIRYMPCMSRYLFDAAAASAIPTQPIHAVPLFGASHCRLLFQDNVSTATPVVSGESGLYEVWWLSASGVWLHSHTDDFDVEGVGQVELTTGSPMGVDNVAAVYNCRGMFGVYVRKISGNDFYLNVEAWNEEGLSQ